VKGLDVLLDAWSRVDRRHGARLLLIGDGTIRADLERRAATLHISDTVVFVGHVSSVPQHLVTADIYVQSSHQEGLPNSVLEAMACGLPVVATRVGGTEELVVDGDNGLLVPPGDAGCLAAALSRLLQDGDARRRMGQRSRARILACYELSCVLEQLEHLYAVKRIA
jgi:glycosyltransferase involved in cell wall biosynthesis